MDDLLWNVYTNADKKDKCYTISKHNVAYIETFDNPMDKTSMLRINEFAGLTDKEFIASQNISCAHLFCRSNFLQIQRF